MKFLKNIPNKSWVILISLILICVISGFRLLNSFELFAYDLQMRLRPQIRQAGNIVIIEVDDGTLEALGQWPLPRQAYTELIYILKKSGVRTIVFDLLFSESAAEDQDISLIEAVRNSGNVYMAYAFQEPQGRAFPQESRQVLSGILQPLRESAIGVGHIDAHIDFDGKTRVVPSYIKYEDKLVPQLALMVACDYLGLNSHSVIYKGGKLIINNKLAVPALPNGQIFVNYPALWQKSFRHYSYAEIYRANIALEQGRIPDIDLKQLKGAICFVGLTATATTDIRPNPLERLYPMVGLHASILNSVITGQFICPAAGILNILLALFVFIAALFICLKFPPLRAFGASFILGVGYFLLSMGLFIVSGLLIDVFFPESIIALTYIGTTLYRFFNEIKKRQLMEKELDIARDIQKSFLPSKDVKEVFGISVSCFMQPAKFVAGDLYDILSLKDSKLGVFIGDVSGKGVPASLIMAQSISLFRVFANQQDCAHEVLERLNKELYGKFEGRFVTCLYMIIDSQAGKVQVSSAGHSPVLVYQRVNNTVLEVELTAGMPLGVMDETEYVDVSFELKPNDKVMVYTDGLSEARDRQSREFGYEKAKRIFFEHGNASSDRILKVTKEELSRFTAGAPQHDDITIIVLANRKES